MNMNRNDHTTLDEILDEIMLQESKPTHEALLRWCKRYPELRDGLEGFFATWAIQEEASDRPVVDEDLVANRAVSHALNLLYQQSHSMAAETPASAEVRLNRMIKVSGVSEKQLMSDCRLDDTLLAKLDRHLIVFDSIPRACIEKLSLILRRTKEDVCRAVMGEPISLAAYKAKVKPVTRQETFLDAVATSELPDTAKKEWEEIVSNEKQR